MKLGTLEEGRRTFAKLRAFAQRVPRVETCELCHVALAEHHPHLLNLDGRRLVCSCDPCAMLFTGGSASRYRRLPSQIERLADFRITDAEWEALGIPINLAFFVRDAEDGSVSARYPSPGGATEARISRETWGGLTQAHSMLEDLEPEVQALLVNRVDEGRKEAAGEYYLVPIDLCYRLVGLIRRHWRGFSGGTEVWQEVESFFSQMRSSLVSVRE